MFKRFTVYYKPHMKVFIADLLCALALAAIDLFYPMITRNMLDVYIPDKNMRLLLIWSGIAVILYFVKLFFNYFVTYYGHVMGVHMQADMRRKVFSHLQDLPFSYYDDHKTGTIMSRVVNDLFDVSELAHHGPEDLFLSAVLLIGSFILMAGINLPLTLIIYAALPIFLLYMMHKRIDLSAAFKRNKVEIGEVNATLENSLSGIRVSKSYTNKAHELERFESQNQRFVEANKRSYKVMAHFHPVTAFMTDFLNLVVMIAGGIFVFNDWITVGDFAAFIIFVNVFMNPIKKLIAFVEQYQNGMAGFVRFTELMDEEAEQEAPDAITVGRLEGEIALKGVTFAYDEHKNILTNLSMTIPKGERVALVGPSGAGKTTICNIIPRFYPINAGTITIDGIDTAQMTLESLRQNIGMVAQDVFLFTGSIYENIAYGRQGATREEVEKAAKDANIHDFILSLPDGYDTYVGERGVKLSGGQKQRISIARAFLKDPAILILDEATSALDNATELAIQQSLDRLCKGRTTLIVAHRLSTIKNADEIIVIGDEGILERGNHADLMAKQGIYATLYNTQFENM